MIAERIPKMQHCYYRKTQLLEAATGYSLDPTSTLAVPTGRRGRVWDAAGSGYGGAWRSEVRAALAGRREELERFGARDVSARAFHACGWRITKLCRKHSLARDNNRGTVRFMREIFLLVIHLLTTLAKFLRPGGVRAVAAESLLLKHQLLISNRSRQRAPNLTSHDRFLLGLTALFLNPRRIPKLAVILKPATLLKFHQALVQHKYRLLFSSSYRRKSGPIGPSAELIAAIVE
jgi:hypothetical protein